MQRVCVFCGSTSGVNGAYTGAAAALGRVLAEQGIGIVFGGGATGVMGALADAALAVGGEVIGVLPAAMNLPGVVHPRLTTVHVVDAMHTRKALMHRLADAFIALPGGLGTLDELFEVLTLSQLGYQPKPIGLLNVEGYFDPLLTLIDHAVSHGFVRPENRGVFTVAADPEALLAQLRRFVHPLASSAMPPSI